jgi:iron(III) transport system permease protein
MRRPPLLLIAAAVVAVTFSLLPLAYLVVRAGTGGIDAWEILTRRATLELFLRTGALVASVVAAAIVVGVPLAWLVVRSDLPGRRVWAVAAALPLVIPSYVAALALLGAFGPRGLLQQLLEGPFGVERLPEIYGFPGAFLALTLATYPYVFLLTAAALRAVDPSLEEAARGLGRTPLAVFREVTLPALRPAIGAGGLLVALYSLADFGAVSLMQYRSVTHAIYLQYRSLFDRTPAAVLALVLVALTATVLALEGRSSRRARLSRTSPGAARQAPRVALGSWRWPALAFCSAVVGFFLAVPLLVLVYWTARAVEIGRGVDLAWHSALNSVLASGLAAIIAVLVALPIAYLVERHRSPWTRFLERAAYSANALPGLVIALSLVFFAARYGGPHYQTLALLLFAYVVRFLPQALAGSSSAVRMVDPRLEEAARGLGRSPLRVAARITAPLAAPGILAGGALVFLSAMKELPATLLLRPIGFETLATEIWRHTALGAYSRAAPSALLLILVSAPLLVLLGARRESDLGSPG